MQLMKSDTERQNRVRTKCRPSQNVHWFLLLYSFWSFVSLSSDKLCKGPQWSQWVFRSVHRHVPVCVCVSASVQIWTHYEVEIHCSFGRVPTGEGHGSVFLDTADVVELRWSVCGRERDGYVHLSSAHIESVWVCTPAVSVSTSLHSCVYSLEFVTIHVQVRREKRMNTPPSNDHSSVEVRRRQCF